MLDEFRGSYMFSKIDLKSGYHRIRMKLEINGKPSYIKYGLHEWLVSLLDLLMHVLLS